MATAVKCEKNDHLSSKDENGSSSTSDASKEDKSESELNSYKFPRPRVYVKKLLQIRESASFNHTDDISFTVGLKPRLPEYDSYIERQLQLSQPSKKNLKGIKMDELKSCKGMGFLTGFPYPFTKSRFISNYCYAFKYKSSSIISCHRLFTKHIVRIGSGYGPMFYTISCSLIVI
jgi:hypothetical protein